MRHSILLLLLTTFVLRPAASHPVDTVPAVSRMTDAGAVDNGQAADVPVEHLVSVERPDGYTLFPAYPNPFNPQTSFSLTVDQRQEVTVEVFNLLGVRIRHLYHGVMESGEKRTFTFTAEDLPSGIYLYRVQGESFTVTRQMTLLK